MLSKKSLQKKPRKEPIWQKFDGSYLGEPKPLPIDPNRPLAINIQYGYAVITNHNINFYIEREPQRPQWNVMAYFKTIW